MADIKGYVPQNEENLARVNENKLLEEIVLRHLDKQLTDDPNMDARWWSMARSSIQNGFMQLNRAVMQPECIDGNVMEVNPTISRLVS